MRRTVVQCGACGCILRIARVCARPSLIDTALKPKPAHLVGALLLGGCHCLNSGHGAAAKGRLRVDGGGGGEGALGGVDADLLWEDAFTLPVWNHIGALCRVWRCCSTAKPVGGNLLFFIE